MLLTLLFNGTTFVSECMCVDTTLLLFFGSLSLKLLDEEYLGCPSLKDK
jgi:hypothetical protein